ncbi:hypothetical protein [Hyphomicrobium sp.]|uniref:hypothetical protein n=1 Tax=Hyphomicrobium sp. TaxID=82 RepID=UPI002E2F8504|nr:hypothetical protein [Hyphomicrobium sp.]HEX2842357.1 hypothetical protein [Hyphomicrobium sp.]
MAARFLRSLVSVSVSVSMLAGCAHYNPEPMSASGHEVVDVRDEHPIMNGLSSMCTDRDLLCILAGFAIFGGAVAAIKGGN